jgi:uncharacterized protein YbjT (DUF2867 family)
MLGAPVVRRLVADGQTVKVMTRSPDRAKKMFGKTVEVVTGDVQKPKSLDTALQGCTAVHVNLASRDGGPDLERKGVAAVTEVARKRGLDRITYLSGATVEEENCWFPPTKAKFDAEEAIRASGVPYTIFKATWFMESLHRMIKDQRAFILGSQPHPWHWIAAEDYARMVSRAYSNPAAMNMDFYVYGPEPLTMRQALEAHCKVAHPDVRVRSMSLFVAGLMASLLGKVELKAALPLFTYFERVGESGDGSEAHTILGRPKITLEEWGKTEVAARKPAKS